jgi:ribosomal protein L5
MNTLQEFKKKGIASLQKKLSLKNVHEVPQIDKVIIAM